MSANPNMIGVIGAGSFGTSLAILLASKGYNVKLTTHSPSHIEAMRKDRENKKYLPGVPLPNRIQLADSQEDVIEGADLVLFAVPAQHFRGAFEQAVPFLTPETTIVNVAKGIELGTQMRMSEIAHILRRDFDRYVCLSGPSHAEEVARALPTTVVAASENTDAAKYVQDVFMTDRFRVYTGADVVGVELGGSLKNIIALGAGISDGIGYGDNAKAALMTRGMTEIIRLGDALGARRETFSGLTGMGDLIVTCTSMHSRNRRCGIKIGQGMDPQEAIASIGMVVEGATTAEAAWKLAKMKGVEMPITECIVRTLAGDLDVHDAVDLLMNRKKKAEINPVRI